MVGSLGGLNSSGILLAVSEASDPANLIVDENFHARFSPFPPPFIARLLSVFHRLLSSLNERRFSQSHRLNGENGARRAPSKHREKMDLMDKMDIRLKTPIKNGAALIKTRK